ncbi:MAG: hypothetical protein A2269_00380 [Lentisphaerae bacterium RIFOXYA12_FULL_60_10]|nr:MAG: hypothetical protein A2269_00380 [Lentisphaerae bacterium RIFOXYA12_FULL_60_10]
MYQPVINLMYPSRSEIDAWPVTETGFPPRVVHACGANHIHTIGELRNRLANALPGLGARSRMVMVRFIEWTDRIAAGDPPFTGLMDVLGAFLTESQIEILIQRFGLRENFPLPPDRRRTLQSIGTTRQVSRERVRQVEFQALATLRSRLPQACLSSIHQAFMDFISQQGGALTGQEVAAFPNGAMLDGCSPMGVLNLLCVCHPPPTFFNGCFTLLDDDQLAQLTARVNAILNDRPLIGGGDFASLASRIDLKVPGGITPRIALTYLDHAPEVLKLRDGRYARPGPGVEMLVRQIFIQADRPLHFKIILTELNTLLKSGSRIGSGHVLEVLNGSPGFERTSSGYYRLRPAGETT